MPEGPAVAPVYKQAAREWIEDGCIATDTMAELQEATGMDPVALEELVEECHEAWIEED